MPKFLEKSFVLGLIALGCAGFGALFLHGLQWIGDYRNENPNIIYGLPMIGILMLWIYQKYGQSFARGIGLIQSEIQSPRSYLSPLMLPFILLSTWLSHLFGASVGREGTALQMSASWADYICKKLALPQPERSFYLKAALAAGFAAVFGTPLAAIFFCFEFSRQKINAKHALWIAATAYLAYYFCQFLHAPHGHYSIDVSPQINLKNILYLSLAAFIFGLTARFYIYVQALFHQIFGWVKSPLIKPFLGGIIFLLAVVFCGEDFLGLSLPLLQKSFVEPVGSFDFFIKISLTTWCLAAGFKGGEVTPLFVIGACLGNILSLYLPLPMGFLAGMGFVSVFSACAKTPLACSFMAFELFGADVFVFGVLSCYLASYTSGKNSIYSV